jgi:hypothetical protein
MTDRRLDEFLPQETDDARNSLLFVSQVQFVPLSQHRDGEHSNHSPSQIVSPRASMSMIRHFDFEHLVSLRRKICSEVDHKLRVLLQKHHFIGFCDGRFCLIQCENSIYIVEYPKVIQEFFYQVLNIPALLTITIVSSF